MGDVGGRGCAQSLIRTTNVQTCQFDQVTEEHACSEGEGDRTLAG